MKRNPWTTNKTRKVYDNPWIAVSESDVTNPAGGKGIYGVIHFKNIAVGVLALDEKERVLLVGQYRYPLGLYSWEIPEGGSPIGTSALTSAKRELKEETGYKALKWKKLFTMHLSNSCSDERAEIYLASELVAGESEPEETEELGVKWLPLTQALRLVESGKITDAITVAALFQADRLRSGAVRSRGRDGSRGGSRNRKK